MSISIHRQSRAKRINARRGQEIILPELGEPVLLRRTGLTDLMQSGSLPDVLTPVVNEMIAATEGKNGDQAGEIAQKVLDGMANIDRVRFVTQLYNATLMSCGVDPVFVQKVRDEDHEVSVDDVSFADKQFVFEWAQGGNLEELTARFRPVDPQPSGDVGTVQEGGDVQEDPIGVVEG